MTTIDPVLADLHAAALDDSLACGPLSDRFVELGRPIEGALARYGMSHLILYMVQGQVVDGGWNGLGRWKGFWMTMGQFLLDQQADPSRSWLRIRPAVSRTNFCILFPWGYQDQGGLYPQFPSILIFHPFPEPTK